MPQGPLKTLFYGLFGSVAKAIKVDSQGAVYVVSESGGEAVSIADGADITQGAKADAAWNGVPGAASVVSVLKAIWTALTTAVTTQPKGGSFLNIAANGTSAAIKTGAGVLQSITINTKGATANVMTVYDSLTASGTKIGTFDTTAGPSAYTFNAAFATGLTVVLATGTAADVTVIYR